MVQIAQIDVGDHTAVGVRVDLSKAPLLLIKAARGFLMCGYLNVYSAEQLGDVAAVVRGVSTFEEMLEASVRSCTAEARALGIKEGETGRSALEKMF